MTYCGNRSSSSLRGCTSLTICLEVTSYAGLVKRWTTIPLYNSDHNNKIKHATLVFLRRRMADILAFDSQNTHITKGKFSQYSLDITFTTSRFTTAVKSPYRLKSSNKWQIKLTSDGKIKSWKGLRTMCPASARAAAELNGDTWRSSAAGCRAHLLATQHEASMFLFRVRLVRISATATRRRSRIEPIASVTGAHRWNDNDIQVEPCAYQTRSQ